MKRILGVLLVVFALFLLSLSGCAAGTDADPAPPSDNDSTEAVDFGAFAEIYLETIRANNESGLSFELTDDYEIVCSLNGEEQYRAFLDNAYNEYLKNGNMEEIINHYVEAVLEMLAQSDPDYEPDYDKNSIMPVIKDAEYIAYAEEIGADLIYDPLLDDEIYIAYVIDLPRTVRSLPESELETLGVQRGELRALAVENFNRELPKPSITEIEDMVGLYIVELDGMYEAGLLISGFLDELDLPITGEMVIGVPSRDFFLIADSNEQYAMEIISGITADSFEEASYPVCGRLMKYTDHTLAWYDVLHHS